jgi:hypothetical protein
MKMNRILIVLAAIAVLSGCHNKTASVGNHKAVVAIVVPEGTQPSVGAPQATDTDENLKKRKLTQEQIEQGMDNANQWYSATVNSVAVGAAELQKYIEKSIGSKPAIITEDNLGKAGSAMQKIFVGHCKATKAFIDTAKLQPEGFVIKTKGTDIYIVGGDATPSGIAADGTLNGCYEFLKQCMGVRWLMPGELGEVVPKTASLNVGQVDIEYTPMLWQRRIRDCHAHIEYGRIAKTLNGWGVSMSDWENFYDPNITMAWFRRHCLGSRFSIKAMHSNLDWWDKYHEKYPDIFAMQPDGTRINTNVRPMLCVSNPMTAQLEAQEKIAEFKKDPKQICASISPNDGGANKQCCCEKCKSWDPPAPKIGDDDPDSRDTRRQTPLTDRYFRYYNEIAAMVASQYPDRYLGVIAYSVYRTPPVLVDHVEDNLFVGYVGFNNYRSDKNRAIDREYWLKWGKLAKQMFIRPNLMWGYMCTPQNYTHKFADDIRFMAAHGLKAADFDGLVGNWSMDGINYYVVAEMLWNPYADVNSIIDDYCRSGYGRGAAEMKIYYDKVEEITNRIASEGKYRDIRSDPEDLMNYYDDAALSGLQSHLDNAIAAIGDSDQMAVARVKLVGEGLDYTKQLRHLILAAYDVRTGKSSKEDFEKVKAEVDKYFGRHSMSWAVAAAHNYTYINNALSLSQAKNKR